MNWGSSGGWADGTDGQFPDWLEISFNGTKTIDEIDVFTIQDNFSSPAEPTESMTFSLFGITDFTVEYWDGANWVMVPGGNVTGNNKIWRKFTFSNITTDKIRIHVTSGLSNNSRLAEVEAYSTSGLSQTPYSGTALAIPGIIQLEDFDNGGEGVAYHDTSSGNTGGAYRSTDVDISGCSDGASCNAITSTLAGEWLEYTVNVATSGIYTLEVRAASNGAGGTFHLEVNGVDKTGSISISTTGGWDTYQTFTKTGVSLNAGQQVIRLAMDSNGASGAVANLNSINFILTNQAPTVNIAAPSNGSSYFTPVSITVDVNASDADGTVTRVEFFEGATRLGEDTTSPYSFTWNNVAAGSYSLTAKATDDLGAAATSTAVSVTVSQSIGGIAGKVTRLDGTTAIAAATVKAYLGMSLAATATTNGTGDYSMPGLSGGTYTVEVFAVGYESKSQIGVTVSNGTTTTVDFSLALPVSYVYDELGRLVAVMDRDGNAAVYNYDPVGNLLSISRNASTQVSILSFNPNSGPVGTPITIYGTGFSDSASQNSVTFNGVAATVITSSPTQILTSVPSGATTGLVSVTIPAGSATSASSFTVTTGGFTAPSITGFSPTIGTPGTAVTVTGNNFDTIPTNNRLTFNIIDSAIGSATSTSIGTTVPQAGSGKLKIVTPNGVATSSADFFIPPTPYIASDVEFTGRMAIGTTQTVTVSTANKVGLMLFDGTAGQRVAINMTNSSISNFNVSIYNPDGSILYPGSTYGIGGGFLDTATMPFTGTYTIMIDPNSTNTGSVSLTVTDCSDFIANITPGGPPVTINITSPGQNANLKFSGAAGQRVSLKVSTAPYNSIVTIIKPNGETLDSKSVLWQNGAFFEPLTLPVNGLYSIVVNPSSNQTGSITLTLYNVPADVTGSITPGGAPVAVTITTPGQNALLTFEATAEQKVCLNITSVTIPSSTVYIKKPDGTTLTQSGMGVGGAFIDTLTLPTAGTYTILVDPGGAETGSSTQTLYDASELTGTITPNGQPVTSTTTVPGQNVRLTFSGNSGQRISLNVSTTPYHAWIGIYRPDGSQIDLRFKFGPNTLFFEPITLSSTGTHTIFVNPDHTLTGAVTLTLYDVPADVTGTITPGGQAVTATITAGGQNGQLTFTGNSGQKISLNMTGVTLGSVFVAVRKPDNSVLTSANVGASGAFFDTKVLGSTGTYKIEFDPAGPNTGSITFSLYEVSDVTGTVNVNGSSVPVSISVPGQNGQFTFTGTSGQQVTVRVTDNNIGGVNLVLLKPDGSHLALYGGSSSTFNMTPQTLPTTGTYTVVVDATGAGAGSLNLRVTSP